jgi:hypothetical protein
MNGTNVRELLEQTTESMYTIRRAMATLRQNSPNGRDYYPAGPQAFTAAVDENEARIAKLRDVLTELEEMAEYLSTKEAEEADRKARR